MTKSREVKRREFEQTKEMFRWVNVFSNEILKAVSATNCFSAPVSSIASRSVRCSTSRANLLGNLGGFLHWHRSAALLWHRLARLPWHLGATLLRHRLTLLYGLLDRPVLARLLGHPLARRLSGSRVAVVPPCFSFPVSVLGIPLVVAITARWTNLKKKSIQ